MASCYCCGTSGATYRRNVRTGTSYGSWTSTRSYGASSRNHYGLRSVCEKCAAQIDRREYVVQTIFLWIIAIFMFSFIIYKVAE